MSNGNDDSTRLAESVQSYAWKQRIAVYHVHEVRRMLEEIGSNLLQTSPEAFFAFLIPQANPDPAVQRTIPYRFYAQAHLIAAAQAVHSLYDIVNHLVYRSLGLARIRAVDDWDINWSTIVRLLSRESSYSQLLTDLQSARGSNSFQYLNAFVNTTKHNMLVLAGSNIDYVNNRAGYFMHAFRYKGVAYPMKYYEDFLSELDNSHGSLTQIAHTLNPDQ